MATWNLDFSNRKFMVNYSGTSSYDFTNLTQSSTTYPEIIIPTLSYQSDFTIEMFIYPTSSGFVNLFTISENTTTNSNLIIVRGIGYNQLLYVINNSAITNLSPNSAPVANQWNHIAISYNSSTKTIYYAVNGTVSSTVITNGILLSQGKPIDILWRRDYNSEYAAGYVDNIRVSQSCIYTANYTIPSPTTVLSWTVGGTTLFYDNCEITSSSTLLCRYSLDGDLTDTGTLGLTPSIVGGTASYASGPTTGVTTNALTLTSTSYLILPYSSALDFTGTTSFSHGGWYYSTSTSYPSGSWFSSAQTSSIGIEIQLTNGSLDFEIYANGRNYVPNSSISTSQWYHLWFVYNSTTRVIAGFVNGTFKGTASVQNYVFNSGQPWRLNSNYRYQSNGFNGKWADVRWYSGLVSPSLAMTKYFGVSGIINSPTDIDGNDGSITNITVIGGTLPYTYSWSDGPTTINRSGLIIGDYTLTVTDSLSVTTTKTFTIINPEKIIADIECNNTIRDSGYFVLSLTASSTPSLTKIIDNSVNNFNMSSYIVGTLNIIDSSPFDNDKCFYLNNNINNYISISNSIFQFNLSTTKITLELWVYYLAYPTYTLGYSDSSDLIGLMNPTTSNRDWSFGVTKYGYINFFYYCGGVQNVTGTTQVSLNRWNHIAVTFDNTISKYRLWLNGVLDKEATSVGTTIFDQSTLVLGRWQNTATANAYITNIRFSKSCLYTENFTPSTIPLTADSNTILLIQLNLSRGTSSIFNYTTGPRPNIIETSTNVTDISSYITGTITTVNDSPFTNSDKCFYFNGGTNNFLQLQNSSKYAFNWWQTGLTAECWIKPGAFSGMPSWGYNFPLAIYNTDSTGNVPYWSFGFNNSGLLVFFYYYGGQVAITGTTILTLNTWYHIAACYDTATSKMRIFLNGIKEVESALPNTPVAGQQYLGSGGTTWGSPAFNAYISNIRVSKDILYTSNFTPATSALTPTANTVMLLKTNEVLSFNNYSAVFELPLLGVDSSANFSSEPGNLNTFNVSLYSSGATWGTSANFIDPTAYWIWESSNTFQTIYLYKSFYLSATTTVTGYCIIDDLGSFYIDNIKIFDVTGAGWVNTNYPRGSTTLNAGWHLITIYSVDSGGGKGTVAALLNSSNNNVITHTDSTWKASVTNTSVIPVTPPSSIIMPYQSNLDFTNTTKFAFGGWFYIISSSSTGVLVSNVNNNSSTKSGIELITTGSTNLTLNAYSDGTTFTITTSTSFTYNKWYFWWVTFDGTTLTLYKNAVSIGTVNISGNIRSYNQWKIGISDRLSNTYINGYTYGLKWYNTNKSASIAILTPDIQGIFVNWTVQNNKYLVSSRDHLYGIMNRGILANYFMTGSTPSNYWNVNYLQTANINMNNYTLTNIGSSSSNFTGSYDGQNYVIQNLLYSNKGNSSNLALFNYISGTTLKNIAITGNLNVYGNNSNDRGTISYGGIAHTALNNNLIQNCSVIASGNIKIDNSVSLICNQMTGNSNIITNCYTNYTGTIDTTAIGSNNTSGIILGKGKSINSSYVLHCTNENIGNSYLGEYYGSGIVGKNATVFGCINKSIGNLDGHITNPSYFTSAITGNGKVIGCINDITGNIGLNSKSSNIAGISAIGDIEYSINCMTGNLNSNSGYGLGKSGKITNSLNYMYGYAYEGLGGNTGGDIPISSNNYCAMSGMIYHISNSNYKQYYATQKYGLSNNIARFPIRNDVWNIYPTSQYHVFFDEIDLPVLQSNLTITVDNSNYIGPTSNWEISFPNNNSNYSQFKYKYDILSQKYKLYKILKSNSNLITSIPNIADGTNSNVLPYYLLSLMGSSNKTNYQSNLNSILITNSNIKNLQEASIFSSLSDQLITPIITNNNKTIDLGSFSNTFNTYTDIYKPAIKNVLKTSISDSKAVIKNLTNTALFDVVLKERSVDKLYVNSNASLASNEVQALFSNQSDLLLVDNSIYNLDLDGRTLVVDTTNSTTLSNMVITFNGSNYTLDSNNSYVKIQFGPNEWKALRLTGLGSGSLEGTTLINITYDRDQNNNYIIDTFDKCLCFFQKGVGYNITNEPNYLTDNFIQTSNIDFIGNTNIMLEGTFKGIYDGYNNKLSNLTYQNTGINKNYALFESIDGATIKNIYLSGTLNVSGSNTINGNICFGGIVYTASNNSLIDNCKIETSGSINIDGNLGLICNNMIGSNGIINNCSTKYSGDIKTIDINKASGGILGYSTSLSNYVLFSVNQNIGNSYLGSKCGVLVGSNATIIGSMNNITGNFNGLENGQNTYLGGIIGTGNAIGCVNNMIGNMYTQNQSTSISGGIIGIGIAQNCINSMIGNISGDNTNGSIGSSESTINNCLNVMKGNTIKAIGGLNCSNNICAMYGTPSQIELNNNNLGIIDYGLNNYISQLSLININNIQSYLPSNIYFQYLSSNYYFNFPYIQNDLSYSINNSNFTNNQSLYTLYPNVGGNTGITSSNFNMFAIRSSDNQLVKLKINSIDYSNLGTLIFNYSGKLFEFNFTWDDNINFSNELKIGIGTNNPIRTLDINGDINLTGNLFYKYIPYGLWYENSNNLIFNESGNIGIGKSNPEYKVDVDGSVRANTYFTVSDIRLKNNINNEDLGLDYIRTLEPKTFSYINDKNNLLRHGFIAQDINNSDFIETDNEGFLSIKIESLISPIIKALQEISKRNYDLKKNLNLI